LKTFLKNVPFVKHQRMILSEHEKEERRKAIVLLMARWAKNGDTREKAQLLLLKNQHFKKGAAVRC